MIPMSEGTCHVKTSITGHIIRFSHFSAFLSIECHFLARNIALHAFNSVLPREGSFIEKIIIPCDTLWEEVSSDRISVQLRYILIVNFDCNLAHLRSGSYLWAPVPRRLDYIFQMVWVDWLDAIMVAGVATIIIYIPRLSIVRVHGLLSNVFDREHRLYYS